MSEENIERVERLIRLGNERDRDALLEHVDPDVEWHPVGLLFDQQAVYRGHDELWKYVTQVDADVEQVAFELAEPVAAGDLVVASVRAHGRGRSSGADVEMRWASVFTFSAGKLTRVDNYLEREEALRAAGLDAG